MKTAFEEYNQIVASIPKEVHAEVDMEMAMLSVFFGENIIATIK